MIDVILAFIYTIYISFQYKEIHNKNRYFLEYVMIHGYDIFYVTWKNPRQFAWVSVTICVKSFISKNYTI